MQRAMYIVGKILLVFVGTTAAVLALQAAFWVVVGAGMSL